MAQRTNNVMGNLFNPIIASYITGFARAQLYDFVRKNGIDRNVVFFATDSICTRTKLDIDSMILGDFSFQELVPLCSPC